MDSTPLHQRRVAARLVALCAAAVSVVVYRDVLRAYFWNDDFAWLFLLHDGSLGEFLLTPLGGHTLVARNAVFALLDAFAGLDPRFWFATVLFTHGVNVVLLSRLVWLATGNLVLAGIGALAWGTCPAAGETLTWYSAYAQVAATTCLLAALGRVAVRARAGQELSTGDLGFVAAWLTLSSLFFGTAVAVAVVWPLVLVLLLPGRALDPRSLIRGLAAPALVLVVYVTLQLVAARAYGAPIIAIDVLRWLIRRSGAAIGTLAELLRTGVAALLLGTWWAPEARAESSSWLTVVAVGVFVLAPVIARVRGRQTVLAFALLALAAYGVVAIARGPVGDPLFGLSPTQVGGTLRYQYAPQAFLAVALCAATDVLAAAVRSWARYVLAVSWGILCVAGQLRHPVVVDLHDASRAEVTRALTAMRTETEAIPPGEIAYVDNLPISAFGWVPNTFRFPPGLAALFVIAFPSDTIEGRPIRFIERDPAVREPFFHRTGRTSRLLVPAPPSARSDDGQARPRCLPPGSARYSWAVA